MRGACTRRGPIAALILMAAVTLVGCATRMPAMPPTTVVLMPDEDGKVGAVSVASSSGTEFLDQGYTYSMVETANSAPSKASPVDRNALESNYGALIKAQTPVPVMFTLYFLLDRTELTEASKAQLPALYAAVRQRKPTSITVFGHADATGSPIRNMKLSADRAEMAAGLLRSQDASLKDIDVQFFGETKPLTQSGPDASEARNRRVEILIL